MCGLIDCLTIWVLDESNVWLNAWGEKHLDAWQYLSVDMSVLSDQRDLWMWVVDAIEVGQTSDNE